MWWWSYIGRWNKSLPARPLQSATRLVLQMDDTSRSSSVVDTQYEEEGLTLAAASNNPKLCIDLLSRGFDPSCLQRVLQGADQTWTEQFLLNGGLSKLFVLLENKESPSQKDLQGCVSCVKIVLKHRLGAEIFLERPEHNIKQLVLGKFQHVNSYNLCWE